MSIIKIFYCTWPFIRAQVLIFYHNMHILLMSFLIKLLIPISRNYFWYIPENKSKVVILIWATSNKNVIIFKDILFSTCKIKGSPWQVFFKYGTIFIFILLPSSLVWYFFHISLFVLIIDIIIPLLLTNLFLFLKLTSVCVNRSFIILTCSCFSPC